MPELLVGVPVLGRPKNAALIVESVHAATPDATILFLVSPGDQAQLDACEGTDAGVIQVTWAPGPGDFARKLCAAGSGSRC